MVSSIVFSVLSLFMAAAEEQWQANLAMLEQTATVQRLRANSLPSARRAYMLAPHSLSSPAIHKAGRSAPATRAPSPKNAAAAAAEEEATSCCCVCQEETAAAAWVCPRDASHAVCADDLVRYIAAQLDTHEVQPLPCPGFRCPGHVPVSVAEGVLAPHAELLARFQRVCALTRDPTAHCCPGCAAVVTGGSRAAPDMHCEACGLDFCFLHETAHAGIPCAAAGAGGSRWARAKTALWKKVHTKACPSCGIAIQKNKGCSHMYCTACHTHFCWWCGRARVAGVVHQQRIIPRHGDDNCHSPRMWALRASIVLGFPVVALGAACVAGALKVVDSIEDHRYRARMRRQTKAAELERQRLHRRIRTSSGGRIEIIHVHRID